MLGTRFGIGRSLLMLMLGLTLAASFAAPATAWAEEAPPVEAGVEAPELTDEEKKAAEEAAAKAAG